MAETRDNGYVYDKLLKKKMASVSKVMYDTQADAGENDNCCSWMSLQTLLL